MKKAAIRKAVVKAMDKHMPRVIDDVARSKAFGAVYDAMAPEEPDPDDAPAVAPVSRPSPSAPASRTIPVARTTMSPGALAAARLGRK